jgi:ABC-type bacteriocin/lantibiotic exporter with double-glycine peptidase domain
MSAISEEAISCIRTVKAFSTESFETEKYKTRNAEAFKLGKKAALYKSLWVTIAGFVFNGVFALDIWYGSIL